MIGRTTGIEKTVQCAAGAATAWLIAKPGADDHTFAQATSATDALLGVFQHISDSEDGPDTDTEGRVMLTGVSAVIYGGAVSRGDALTSDTAGRAVKATASGQRLIGFATVSGAAGDRGYCLIAQGHYAAGA